MAGSAWHSLVSRPLRRFSSHAPRQLAFEPLEDRCLLAVFNVTNLNDAPVTMPGAAPGTLRQAIFDANNLSGADTIKFAPILSGPVNLSIVGDTAVGPSALLVTSPITIQGNENGITIQRDPNAVDMRLFRVSATGSLALDSIMLTGGIARGANGSEPGENGGEGCGGAVFNDHGTLEIVASTLYGNQAVGGIAGAGGSSGRGFGGAVYNDDGTVNIQNSTFSANSAFNGIESVTASFGGAIYGVNGSLTIYNSTITNSTAWVGRGVYIVGVNGTATVEVEGSIIAQADAPASIRDVVVSADSGGEVSVTGGNNLIRTQIGFATEWNVDPLFGPLSSNGGPTLTHALLGGSPALDQGSNLLNLSTDGRGASYARVVSGRADIGAFERQTGTVPALLGDYNDDHTVDAADQVMWRKTLDMEVPLYSGADGSGNGLVDPADYSVWRMHFGETLAAAATVFASEVAAVQDEPASLEFGNAEFERQPVSIAVPRKRKEVSAAPATLKTPTHWASLNESLLDALLARTSINPREDLSTQTPQPGHGTSDTDAGDFDSRTLEHVWANWPALLNPL